MKKYALYTIWGVSRCSKGGSKTVHSGKSIMETIVPNFSAI